MPSQGFQENLFTRFENFEEGPLRDRKRIIPNLWDDRSRAEFLRDVIALANSARMLGRPAYLLFGIDDAGNLFDIADSLSSYEQRARRRTQGQGWDERRVEECLWREIIEHRMLSELLAEYVDADLAGTCRLEYGLVDDSLSAYLLIPPRPAAKPYQMQKPLTSGNTTLLAQGGCWIRIAESKQEIKARPITPDTGPYCYAFTQVPYPLPSQWLGYFQRLSGEQFHQAYHEIPGYQDLRLITGEALENALNDFLKSSETKLLVIRGKAGSGKSVSLLRLVYRLAEGGAFEMEQSIHTERFAPPASLIPIHVPLRGWQVGPEQRLDREFVDCLNDLAHFWQEPPDMPELILAGREYHWLICLDGLDEIWSLEHQRSFVSALARFHRQYPAVKIILATRPDVTIAGLQNPTVVDLGSLTPEQMESYVSANALEDTQVEEVIEFLKSEPDLWTLCGAPAFLEAATSAWLDEFYPPRWEENTPIPDEELNHDLVRPVAVENFEIESEVELEDLRELVDASFQAEVGQLEVGDAQPPENFGIEDDVEETITVPIRLGRVLDRIYRHIWDRERSRKLVEVDSLDQWFEGTGELAAWMDGNRNNTRHRRALEFLRDEEGLHWLLSLGVLERALRGGWISFMARITKTYFAASFVLPFVEENDLEEPLAYLHQGRRPFWEETLAILGDLTYSDISLLEQEMGNLPTDQ